MGCDVVGRGVAVGGLESSRLLVCTRRRILRLISPKKRSMFEGLPFTATGDPGALAACKQCNPEAPHVTDAVAPDSVVDDLLPSENSHSVFESSHPLGTGVSVSLLANWL